MMNLRMMYMPIHINNNEKKRIFYKPKNVKLNIQEEDDIAIMDISTLEVVDNKSGIKLYNHDGVPMFILIPRDDSLIFLKNNKFKIIKAIENMRKHKGNCKRGKNRTGRQIYDKTKYTTIGPTACRNNHGFITSFPKKDKNKHDWNTLHKLINFIEDKCEKYLPRDILKGISQVKDKFNYPRFPIIKDSQYQSNNCYQQTKIYTSLALARDYYSAAHIDEDFFLSAMISLNDDDKEIKFDGQIITHFCFPECGYAVALRDGDCLIFNPKILHCCAHQETLDNGSVLCSSVYLKSNIIGGNDNR